MAGKGPHFFDMGRLTLVTLSTNKVQIAENKRSNPVGPALDWVYTSCAVEIAIFWGESGMFASSSRVSPSL